MKFSTKLLSVLFALFFTLSLCIGITACKNATDASDATAQKTFTFKVIHKDGTEKSFEIKTDEKYVGDALIAEGLISGDQGDYGLYIKVVDGETADYDVDQSYWAFYIGDEYALTGVDTTPVTDGGVYSLKYSK